MLRWQAPGPAAKHLGPKAMESTDRIATGMAAENRGQGGLDQIELAPGLIVPRVLIGLWQVADLERGDRTLDADRAADALQAYADAGFRAFDMADHYGSAELIAGRLLARRAGFSGAPGPDAAGTIHAFTKWCPRPGPMDAQTVRAGIDERCARLGVSRIDLLQFHWWQYAHPAYLDAFAELAALRDAGVIANLGVTNFDTDHLRLLVRDGYPIRTNQVSLSLLDARATGRMSALCGETGIRLLAYGSLAGGFLTDRWVGAAEPAQVDDWSKSKYRRFIDAVGGWAALQRVLAAARRVADRHGVSVANVAVRWVLEQAAVGAVIVGARLTEREHSADNRAVFSFSLDAQDRAWLDDALSSLVPLPGDCGDEYRRAPFLTASGDLGDHLGEFEPVHEKIVMGQGPQGTEGATRLRVDSGSRWESIAGYSRAVRIGERILVSGTTATHGEGRVVCPGDPAAQTVHILDKISAAIESLGGRLEDVVRTRVYLRDTSRWHEVAEVHGRYFSEIRPANTMLGGAVLIGDYEVEIEAEAVMRSARAI